MTDRPVTGDLGLRVLEMSHGAFGVLRLGGDLDEEAALRLDGVLGFALPQTPNTAAGTRPRALWTAPREWTLIDAGPAQIEAVQAVCGGVLSHYADLGGARAGFHILGQDADALIASECPLDLEAMGADGCAQSVFAGMPILVDRRRGEEGFRLYVDTSLAEHLRAWLAAVAEGLD